MILTYFCLATTFIDIVPQQTGANRAKGDLNFRTTLNRLSAEIDITYTQNCLSLF